MGGRPKDPAYWRKWRLAHPEYRRRESARKSRVRKAMTPEERRRDRGARKPVVPVEELQVLHPHLQHGVSIAFWEDELRLDLAQEAWLAQLEGRDIESAVSEYRKRELAWRHMALPLLVDGERC